MRSVLVGVVASLWASTAMAGVCDYRPSEVLGAAGAAAAGAAAGALAGASGTAQALGIYTLVHAGSGATMLGSTLGGASAAGTVGIIGGTGGIIGTVGAIVAAPATLILAGGALAVGSIYEGACYFTDERVTDPEEVRARLAKVAATADPAVFRLEGDTLFVADEEGNLEEYKLENLYITNGWLMHRDWFKNTTIGKLGFVRVTTAAGPDGSGN